MEKETKHFRFVNSQTGNVIAYLSVEIGAENESELLENKKKELAVANGIYVETIYWECEK